MAIRSFKPNTPGTRSRVVTDFSEVTSSKPERSLVVSKHRKKGRNNRGVITCRHRGGGHKRLYRIVDFRRNKHGVSAKVSNWVSNVSKLSNHSTPNPIPARLCLVTNGQGMFLAKLSNCSGLRAA